MTDGGSEVPVAVEFSGGLELLVAGAKRVDVALPARAHCMRDLIRHVRETVVQERPELFSVDDTVRPGIIVLINDVDWELEGRLDYEIQPGDCVAFISTLHGG